MSQLVAMENWPERLSVGAVAALMLVTAVVNARLLLMSASLYPLVGTLPAWQIYPSLHLVTDPGWLIAMRYRSQGGSDFGVFLGASVLMFLVWNAAVAAGHLLGTIIVDPRRFGIDLVMPVFFAAMLVPLWRGVRRSMSWAVAGAVALLVQQAVGGWWFIIAGAVAGSVVGGFTDDAD
jgi:predicted branched-subunit amino acid permease